jgi:hypothetical protein
MEIVEMPLRAKTILASATRRPPGTTPPETRAVTFRQMCTKEPVTAIRVW